MENKILLQKQAVIDHYFKLMSKDNLFFNIPEGIFERGRGTRFLSKAYLLSELSYYFKHQIKYNSESEKIREKVLGCKIVKVSVIEQIEEGESILFNLDCINER